MWFVSMTPRLNCFFGPKSRIYQREKAAFLGIMLGWWNLYFDMARQQTSDLEMSAELA